MPVRPLPALAALALFSLFLLLSPDANALSRRNQAAVEALQQRMDAAEKRYRDGLLAEDEVAAATATTAALAEIREVVAACADQKGCELPAMLAVYERLLKATPQPVEPGFDEDGGPIDEFDLAEADVPESADASSLLSEDGKRFVGMVQFNPAVQAGIRRWLTDMRPSLMDSYENYRYLQRQMSPAFKRHGLPEALLFGILAKESNGKVHAGSRAGAVGPLQFMPATGRRFGLGVDITGFDTRYDPRASADAAAQYLVERMGQLNDSIELSLAGYNGGEGRALRIFRESGGRSFWDADVYSQFPAETKDYVPMVIAAAWLFLHPREYGISWPRVRASHAVVRLEQPASLYELAICLGNAGSRDGYLRALRNLNPRWGVDSTMPTGTVLDATTRIAWLYQRHCTRGQRLKLAQQLVESNVQAALVRTPEVRVGDLSVATGDAGKPAPAVPKSAPKPASHTVRRGETLSAIVRRFSCDLRGLARANGIKAPKYAIRPGQKLKLEGCGG